VTREPGGGSRIPPALVAAYRAARYRVSAARPPFELMIDAPSAALAACHRAYGVERSAFLTAWNPASIPASGAANSAAAARLEGRLRGCGYRLLGGQGLDPAGQWAAEDSVLVLGIGLAEASAIGREFGQAALLHAGPDAVPRLVLLQ
jgi:hypothetical protein